MEPRPNKAPPAVENPQKNNSLPVQASSAPTEGTPLSWKLLDQMYPNYMTTNILSPVKYYLCFYLLSFDFKNLNFKLLYSYHNFWTVECT